MFFLLFAFQTQSYEVHEVSVGGKKNEAPYEL